MTEKPKEPQPNADDLNTAVKSAPLKKSAVDVIDGYYKRRYIMYKEMYEHGNASR